MLAVSWHLQNVLGKEMAARAIKKLDTGTEKSQLSKQDVRLLLVACTDLINVCAKLTGKIDPAATAMLAYVRDDMLSDSKVEL
jgi:hypothetical protein